MTSLLLYIIKQLVRTRMLLLVFCWYNSTSVTSTRRRSSSVCSFSLLSGDESAYRLAGDSFLLLEPLSSDFYSKATQSVQAVRLHLIRVSCEMTVILLVVRLLLRLPFSHTPPCRNLSPHWLFVELILACYWLSLTYI